jgi:hypothetical protein
LGGPYSTATEYYRAWIVKHASKPGATSTFISEFEAIVHQISDRGPFHLIHPDFGCNNMIIDDEYNILAVIDWEESFAGPTELAAQLPLRLRIYPEEIYSPAKNDEGVVIDGWSKVIEERPIFLAGVEAAEAACRSVSEFPKLSKTMMGSQEDILYLMARWEQGVPWLLTYEPVSVKSGVAKVIEKLCQRRLKR